MSDVEFIIRVPALLAERLAANAGRDNVTVEQHVVRVLLAEALRSDAERHAARVAEHPEAHAHQQRQAVADAIERDVAILVDDGLDPTEAAALTARLLADYDLTQTPGYLDPSNTTLPMSNERHIAILRATVRADHHQRITDVEHLAADAGTRGDEQSRGRYLAQAQRLRQQPLP